MDAARIIKALAAGGAHLDFRAKDGMTSLHKAARSRNAAALMVSDQSSSSPLLVTVSLVLSVIEPAGKSVVLEMKICLSLSGGGTHRQQFLQPTDRLVLVLIKIVLNAIYRALYIKC